MKPVRTPLGDDGAAHASTMYVAPISSAAGASTPSGAEHDTADTSRPSPLHYSGPTQCARAHTHTHLTALCPGLPGRAGTRKVKPIWILLKQQTVSGSGISWAICKSAPRSRQIIKPHQHTITQFFTGRMPFLSPNQQRQSTERNGPTQYTEKQEAQLSPRDRAMRRVN